MSEQRIPKPKRQYVRVKMGTVTQIVRKEMAERFVKMPWYSDPVKRDPRFFSPAELTPIPDDSEQATERKPEDSK